MKLYNFIPHFRYLIMLSVLLLFIFDGELAARQTVISGLVTDQAGTSLPLANIYLEGTTLGTVSDLNGRFRFTVNIPGEAGLVISVLGYKTWRKTLVLSGTDSLDLEVRLREEALNLGEASVTGSAFSSGNLETATLSPIEIVTTPGAAADIFRAFQLFPGVSQVQEGAGLYVRGGSVDETTVLLDMAIVAHPYRNDAPNGGFFGTIPPFLIGDTFFSTGGFPARYGNALSGVLAMESRWYPDRNEITANVGLNGVATSVSADVIPDKLGVHASANLNDAALMFDLNGIGEQFQDAPVNQDLNLSLIFRPDKGRTFRSFTYLTRNELGVSVLNNGASSVFTNGERTFMQSLKWTELAGNLLINSTLAFGSHERSSDLGMLDIRNTDQQYQWRSDIEYPVSNTITWYGGIESVHRSNGFAGTFPETGTDLSQPGRASEIDESFGTTRTGIYTELGAELTNNLSFNTGLRSDLHHFTLERTVSPRLSASYQIADHQVIRFATGIYHQLPLPFQMNDVTGNGDLRSERAVHYILGYEFNRDPLQIRSEFYIKNYDNLILQGTNEPLLNSGYGFARGADVFLRYSRFLQNRINGWISYSFLQTERLHARQTPTGIEYQEAPSAFDISHNLTIVAKGAVYQTFFAGITWQYASGRPFTPIEGTIREPQTGRFLPIQGNINSQRFPDFQRLDLNLSYYKPLPDGQSMTFYLSVANVFDRENISGHSWNADYTERTDIRSAFQRFVYAGISINLNI